MPCGAPSGLWWPPAAANVGLQAPTAWMWMPCSPGVTPVTFTFTCNVPVASSVNVANPTSVPVASTMLADACEAPSIG